MAQNPYVQKQLDDAAANRQKALQIEDDKNQYLNNKTNYYDNNEDTYRGKADEAYGDLAQTPGYTDQEKKDITGNPNAGFQYYDPSKLQGDVADNTSDLKGSVGDYSSGLKGAAGDLKQTASDIGSDVKGTANGLNSNLTATAGRSASDLDKIGNEQLGYQGGVYSYQKGANDAANSDLGKGLDSAVDPSKLALSDKFAGDYALSPEQAQNIKDVAGNTVKGQYQREQDQLAQSAFAQGNSSPAQIAAMQQQMGRQGAIDAGNAMSSAELNANTEAAKRQQTLEAMREGTQQDISSRLQSNASTKYGAASGATNTLASNELGGINAAEGTKLAGASQGANLRYGAAATGGAAQVDAAKTAGGYAYGAGQLGYQAADSGGQAAIDASKTSGAQKLATDSNVQQTGQGLAVNADNTGSARATNIANTGIAGQDKVRNYYTGEQGTAQQGSQTSTGQSIQNSGTEGGLAGQATSTGAATTIGQNQVDKAPGEGERLADTTAAMFKFAKGGIVTHPTEGIIGEHGPEMVVPLGGPRRRYRMAA